MPNQKLFFILTCGSENPTKVTRCFQFAKIAQDKGVLGGIMLVDDAVYLTNPQLIENIMAPTGDKLSLHLGAVIAGGATILCCKPCCATREISEDQLPPGFVLGTGAAAIEISADPTVNTIVF